MKFKYQENYYIRELSCNITFLNTIVHVISKFITEIYVQKKLFLKDKTYYKRSLKRLDSSQFFCLTYHRKILQALQLIAEYLQCLGNILSKDF